MSPSGLRTTRRRPTTIRRLTAASLAAGGRGRCCAPRRSGPTAPTASSRSTVARTDTTELERGYTGPARSGRTEPPRAQEPPCRHQAKRSRDPIWTHRVAGGFVGALRQIMMRASSIRERRCRCALVGAARGRASAGAGAARSAAVSEDERSPTSSWPSILGSRMQRDADGTYYDPGTYTKTGARCEAVLGLSGTKRSKTYRRKYLDLEHRRSAARHGRQVQGEPASKPSATCEAGYATFLRADAAGDRAPRADPGHHRQLSERAFG